MHASVRRGFTLLELVVAMTVALLVFGTASQILIQMTISRRISTARAELLRDASLAMGWMRRDIYAGGAGAMSATNRLGTGNYDSLTPAIVPSNAGRTGPNSPAFSASTLSPSSAAVGFTIIGDVARPDSLMDGISTLPHAAHTTTKLFPTNELTGRRLVADSGNRRAGGVRYDTDCTSTTPMAAGAYGCPWGYAKYRSTAGLNNVQVVYPNGDWEQRTISTLDSPSNGAATSITLGTALTGPASALTSPFPSGMVVQVDRLGYLFDNGTKRVYRRQCWAEPVAAADGPIGFQIALGGAAPNCTLNQDDTDWLTVARNLDITATTITLRDGNNAVTTNPGNVFSIEVNLVLSRNVKAGGSTRKVSVNLRERFFMRSRTG